MVKAQAAAAISHSISRGAMRWPGVVAGVIAAAVDATYLRIVSADNPQFLTTPFLAVFLALMAICALLSSRESARRVRSVLLGAAAGGLIVLGVLAAFSIGVPLLAGGVIALIGLFSGPDPARRSGEKSERRRQLGIAAAGALVAAVALVAGLEVATFAVKCPQHGSMSGGGIDLIGRSYQYSCANGQLTLTF